MCEYKAATVFVFFLYGSLFVQQCFEHFLIKKNLPKTGRLKQKTNNNCPGLGSLEKDSFGALTYL
jgi:hypothetical protein